MPGRFRFTPLLAIAVGFALACGSDNSNGPSTTTQDFAGVWSMAVEVTSKRTCDGTIGEQSDQEWLLGQRGGTAWLDLGPIVVGLSIQQAQANGSGVDGDGTSYDVTLSISEGITAGTVTISQSDPACTEVWSFEGNRVSDALSPGLAGTWDLEIMTNDGECLEQPVGSLEFVCRTIAISRNQIWIEDPDGPIAGVQTAKNGTIFWRVTPEERLRVVLFDNGGSFNGSVESNDTDGTCFERATISGTFRGFECPAPPSLDDFTGDWFVERAGSSTCDFDADTAVGPCVSITAQGSQITVDDVSGRAPWIGEWDGATVVVRRSELGEETLYLRLEDGLLVGELRVVTESEFCGTSTQQISLEGHAIPASCSQPGGPFDGPFNGSWELVDVELDDPDDCFEGGRPCLRLFQVGNRVFMDGTRLNGTVSGNRMTSRRVIERPERDLRVVIDWTIVLVGGGQSLDVTSTFREGSIANPQEGCTGVLTARGLPSGEPCGRP